MADTVRLSQQHLQIVRTPNPVVRLSQQHLQVVRTANPVVRLSQQHIQLVVVLPPPAAGSGDSDSNMLLIT